MPATPTVPSTFSVIDTSTRFIFFYYGTHAMNMVVVVNLVFIVTVTTILMDQLVVIVLMDIMGILCLIFKQITN